MNDPATQELIAAAVPLMVITVAFFGIYKGLMWVTTRATERHIRMRHDTLVSLAGGAPKLTGVDEQGRYEDVLIHLNGRIHHLRRYGSDEDWLYVLR